MKVYHGSNVEIEEIDLNRCSKYKDFGQGFYVTTLESQAMDMARRTVKRFGGKPIVTIFEFDDSRLEEVKFKSFDVSEKWALMVINNRNKEFTDYDNELSNHDNKYDIVYGPIANDKIATTFDLYVGGFYTLTDVTKKFTYNELNNQYSFHTSKSLELLTKDGVING